VLSLVTAQLQIEDEACEEAHAILYGENLTNVRRLSAIIQACHEGQVHGFKLDPGGRIERIPLDDDRNRSLAVRVLEFPNTTVAGIVALEVHDDTSVSAWLLAVGTYSNRHQLDCIWIRGMQRLKDRIAQHGTLAGTLK